MNQPSNTWGHEKPNTSYAWVLISGEGAYLAELASFGFCPILCTSGNARLAGWDRPDDPSNMWIAIPDPPAYKVEK